MEGNPMWDLYEELTELLKKHNACIIHDYDMRTETHQVSLRMDLPDGKSLSMKQGGFYGD